MYKPIIARHVSENGSFLKYGYPQNIHFCRSIHYKPSIFGTARTMETTKCSSLLRHGNVWRVAPESASVVSTPNRRKNLGGKDRWLRHISRQRSNSNNNNKTRIKKTNKHVFCYWGNNHSGHDLIWLKTVT